MTAVTAGVPRLQELSYLEVAIRALAAGETFDVIRRRLLDHMVRLREEQPTSGNTAPLRIRPDNPQQYARNATDTLRELMRLQMVVKKGLPSSAKAAPAYRNARFELTDLGTEWAQQLLDDPRKAYDHLLKRLMEVHPQVTAYLRVLRRGSFVVPLLRWTDVPEPRGRKQFIATLAAHAAQVADTENLGWLASPDEIREAVLQYVDRIEQSALGRKREKPFSRNQDFINSCEEAIVKFAWMKAGVTLDYISQEILRRWTRFLSVANFSYHVPGANALRYWATAEISDVDGEGFAFVRRVGAKYRQAVLDVLGKAYDIARREDPSAALWVPIYRVRAAACWELKLRDEEFDAALEGLLRANLQTSDVPFGVNVDPAMYGNVPPSERPLRVMTDRGERVYYSMSLVLKESRS
jgi:hypothetical protein